MTLLITAAIYAGFAIWLGSTPATLLKTFGIESSTPAMLTEIRAFYGGIEIGIAVAMLVLWRRKEIFAGLLVGGLPLAGSAIGRCCGLIVDDFSGVHVGLAVVEALGAAVCFVACYVVNKAIQLDKCNCEMASKPV
ncbi:MAG: DUF4345 family protein [Pirellulaceae bacterium]